MTDKQIIKAVGICRTQDTCRGCPYHELYISGCVCALMKDVFDLINRQNAEIEKLKRGVTFTFTIEDFESIKETIISNIDNKIKSEAIKEFAEELEYLVLNEDIEVVEPKFNDYESYINGANQFRHQIKNGINNLVKEMTEAQE